MQFVTLQEGGQTKRMTKREAIIKQVVNSAIKGNTKPLQMMLAHLEKTQEARAVRPLCRRRRRNSCAPFGVAGPDKAYVKETDNGDC